MYLFLHAENFKKKQGFQLSFKFKIKFWKKRRGGGGEGLGFETKCKAEVVEYSGGARKFSWGGGKLVMPTLC